MKTSLAGPEERLRWWAAGGAGGEIPEWGDITADITGQGKLRNSWASKNELPAVSRDSPTAQNIPALGILLQQHRQYRRPKRDGAAPRFLETRQRGAEESAITPQPGWSLPFVKGSRNDIHQPRCRHSAYVTLIGYSSNYWAPHLSSLG